MGYCYALLKIKYEPLHEKHPFLFSPNNSNRAFLSNGNTEVALIYPNNMGDSGSVMIEIVRISLFHTFYSKKSIFNKLKPSTCALKVAQFVVAVSTATL